MLIKPNKNFTALREMLEFDKSTQDTLLLIFDSFKGKLLGKIDRSQMNEAAKQKLKRGLKTLKESGYLINSTIRGCYMLNPQKFIIIQNNYTLYEDKKLDAFWYDVWAYLLDKNNLINIDSVTKYDNFVDEINELWSSIPDYSGDFSNWKRIYLDQKYFPRYLLKDMGRTNIHHNQNNNCVDLLKCKEHHMLNEYKKYIEDDEDMQELLEDTLKGKFTLKKFKDAYREYPNIIAHKLGYEVGRAYLYKHNDELII